MRYPAEQKTETHAKIIHGAARSFREHGSDGVNIAGLMQELGLTQGGFYRHFDSKDDLYAHAVAHGLQQVGDRLVAVAASVRKGQALRAVIEYYLSLEHMRSVGSGCVIAALAPELSRQPVAVRKKVDREMRTLMNRLAPYITGSNEDDQRRQVYLLIAAMAGIVMTARAITDPALQKDMLHSARDFYVNAFAEKKQS